ncbi:MAG: hypothetical protein ACW975_02400 [Candidatus Thorarchaeota archaeon]|jgi:hypothetical protein
MPFTKHHLELLSIAHEVLSDRRHLFEVLSDKKYNNIGLEGWLQVELIRAYTDVGYTVIMEGKVKRGCDLIVSKGEIEILLELRTTPRPNYSILNDAIEQHRKAHIYIFLARFDAEKLREYEISMQQEHEFRAIEMDEWVLLLIRKRE